MDCCFEPVTLEAKDSFKHLYPYPPPFHGDFFSHPHSPEAVGLQQILGCPWHSAVEAQGHIRLGDLWRSFGSCPTAFRNGVTLTYCSLGDGVVHTSGRVRYGGAYKHIVGGRLPCSYRILRLEECMHCATYECDLICSHRNRRWVSAHDPEPPCQFSLRGGSIRTRPATYTQPRAPTAETCSFCRAVKPMHQAPATPLGEFLEEYGGIFARCAPGALLFH